MSITRTALPAAAVLLALAGPALGAPSACNGNLRASLVHPLPKPLTVGTSRSIDDVANPELARRFAGGLSKAGLTMVDTGSSTLSIAVSVTAPAGGGSGVTSGYYKGFEWMSGSPTATAGRLPSIRGATLSISAVLTDNTAIAQSWVATIDCRVQTEDPGTLAEFIGNAIGRVVGKDIDSRKI